MSFVQDPDNNAIAKVDTAGNLQVSQHIAEWCETDTQTNAIATASKAAVSGKTHYITSVSAGFGGDANFKKLEIKDGSTVIKTIYVTDSGGAIIFNNPIKATTGNVVSAVLAASGGLATDGSVNLSGFTK